MSSVSTRNIILKQTSPYEKPKRNFGSRVNSLSFHALFDRVTKSDDADSLFYAFFHTPLIVCARESWREGKCKSSSQFH
ncbi:hypothetical protein L1887_09251 [Cichorium endivia]|nr:hypothetical protein L1887_09251 [Cichorium endivia]